MDSDQLRKIAKTTTSMGRGRLEERADVIDYLRALGLHDLATKILTGSHIKKRFWKE